jgi:hypothetical protein
MDRRGSWQRRSSVVGVVVRKFCILFRGTRQQILPALVFWPPRFLQESSSSGLETSAKGSQVLANRGPTYQVHQPGFILNHAQSHRDLLGKLPKTGFENCQNEFLTLFG